MKKATAVLAFAASLVASPITLAQKHADVNGIYERMTAAYDRLDSEAFRDIYADDATYLRSDENPMLFGIEAIIGNYERFFASVREENGRLELRFRVVRRECSATICSDVGWYKLNRYDGDGGLDHTSYGRFLTSPGESADGLWRFLADLDTGATEEHWQSAKQVSGLHFAAN